LFISCTQTYRWINLARVIHTRDSDIIDEEVPINLIHLLLVYIFFSLIDDEKKEEEKKRIVRETFPYIHLILSSRTIIHIHNIRIG
jgi:hypothetical protein